MELLQLLCSTIKLSRLERILFISILSGNTLKENFVEGACEKQEKRYVYIKVVKGVVLFVNRDILNIVKESCHLHVDLKK